ncbi:MAG: flavodoxin domain-containing protein [Hyphomicrobiales bacterium]|nr:flavodoxin domain-containing protein [Hyphomicrobiales bacterium]
MADILIVVGTESGNAQMVAECLQDEFEGKGHGVEILDQWDPGQANLAGRETVLICCATHGMGDLPSNIQPMYDELDGSKPDLSHLRYGVIALGDQTYYDTFCKAGQEMDGLFNRLGARRVGERLEVDASTQPLPDEEALKWAEEWETLL